MENEELLFRNAIECGTVEFDGQTSKAIKDGLTLHPSYSSLG